MIGSLRHRVTVRANTPTTVRGVRSDSWADEATIWAKVEPLGVKELVDAEQVEGMASHRVTMRYRSDLSVTNDKRITIDSVEYDIRWVRNLDLRDKWVEAYVEART